MINRCPSVAIGFKTPEELWCRTPPNYEHLGIFGCVAFAHVNQGKLEPRARRCMFLGYPEGVKGYKLWFQDEKSVKCIISRDVTFKETEMYMNGSSTLSMKPGENFGKETEIEVELQDNSGSDQVKK